MFPSTSASPAWRRRRGKNSWEVLIELGLEPQTGERRRRFFAVKGTKRDAELAETAARHERDTGIDLNPEKMSVAAFLRRWLADYAQHQVAPATFREYRRSLERHVIPMLGSLPLANLRPAHLQTLYGVR